MLTKRCEARLAEIHPDLAAVVRRAAEITTVPFIVTEGLRTRERQRMLVKVGASRTLNSRHLTGHAVDLAAWIDVDENGTPGAGEIRWDWPCYFPIAEAMRRAALQLGVRVVWGGTWESLNDDTTTLTPSRLSRSFPDGPHFELDRTLYV